MQNECQMTANSQTKPTDIASESVIKLLPSTSIITIYYYYSAQKLILILPPHGGQKT